MRNRPADRNLRNQRSITGRVSTGGYSPAVLDLTGWWEDWVDPWVGKASAGTSGSGSISAIGGATGGTALNGHVPVSFDGVNDKEAGTLTIGDLHNAATGSGWFLFKAPAVTVSDPWWALDDGLLASRGTGVFGIYMRVNGGQKIGLAIYSSGGGTGDVVEETFANNTWQLFQYKYDSGSSYIKCRINSGSWQSAALAGNVAAGGLAAVADFGANVVEFSLADVASIGTSKTVISDTDFNNIKSYINTKFGLSL